jgi:hypothetical protein
MISVLRGGQPPRVGSMLQNVIDSVHRMVRSERAPSSAPPIEQIEGGWVVGIIGRRPRSAGEEGGRLLLIERVARTRRYAGAAVGSAAGRRGVGLRNGQRSKLAMRRHVARETPVEPDSIQRIVITRKDTEDTMKVDTDWRGHVERRPWLVLGAALGGGMLVARIVDGVRGSVRERAHVRRDGRENGSRALPTEVGQTWDQIKAAVLAAAAVELFEWAGETLPTFRENLTQGMRHGPLA